MTDPRDWADRPYVRVYQSIRTDEKFAAVYDDDRALAAWLRLLLDADPLFPARPSLPAGLNRHARDVLTRTGILQVTGRTYTLSGLAKERAARALSGAERQALWRQRHRNGSVTEGDVTPVTKHVTPRGGAGASSSVSFVTSSPEGESRGETDAMSEAVAYVEQRSRRPFSFGLGSTVWETFAADVRDLGWPAVKAAMEAVKEPFPDIGQLVFGASRILHPISSPKNGADPDPDYVKEQLAERRKARSAHA